MSRAAFRFVSVLACLAACVGSDPDPTDSSNTQDGGTSDGGGNDGGGDSGPGDCSVVHVAESGNDTSSGCAESAPKKTIGAAIAYASTLGGNVEIHVCRGTYPESKLRLTAAVSLRGGYECTTWTRTPAYGYPMFDAVNETIIANATVEGQSATLLVNGAAVSRNVVIDGFTVRGGPGTNAPVQAISITGGAQVTLTNDLVFGGQSTGASTEGILVDDAAPDIHDDRILGGQGQASTGTFASAGIHVIGTKSPHIHDSFIDGGSGVYSGDGFGSVGALLATSGGLNVGSMSAFEGNTLNGGAGTSNGNGHNRAVGILVQTPAQNLDILSNHVQGGVGDGTGLGPSAIRIDHANDVRIGGNRIYGGDLKTATTVATPTSLFFDIWAVHVAGASGAVTIQNNMISAGNKKHLTTTPPAATMGIRLGPVNDVVIRHNTIYAGQPFGSLAVGTFLGSNSVNTVVENNLFVGSTQTDDAIGLGSCPDQLPIASLQGNGFVAQGRSAMAYLFPGSSGSCGASSATFNTAAMETEVKAKAPAITSKVTANVGVAADCSSDAKCTVLANCTNEQSCTPLVFDAWTFLNDHGTTQLLGAGWTLKSTGLCVFAKSGYDDSAVLTNDLFGTTRTMPPSIGAVEQDTCTP